MTDVREWYVLAAAGVVLMLAVTALAMELPDSFASPAQVPVSSSHAFAAPADVPGGAVGHPGSTLRTVLDTAPDDEGATDGGHSDDPGAGPPADGAATEPEPEPQPEPEPEPQPETEPEQQPAEAEREGRLPKVDPEALRDVAARTGVPERALAAYAGAAMYEQEHRPGCNLDWALLAAIGYVESHHGTIRGGHIGQDGVTSMKIVGVPLDGRDDTREIRDTDGGALDGDATYDRAVGPMQFIPGTWAGWGTDASGDGVADPHHIDDAALSAADYLCASGDLSDSRNWWQAVLRYNQSEQYARRVLEYNNHYARRSHGSS